MSKQLSIHMRIKPTNWMWLPINKKKCNKCGHVHWMTDFIKESQSPDGRQHRCMYCKIEKRLGGLHIDLLKKPSNWMWLPINERRCSKCREVKHITEFCYNNHRSDGGRNGKCMACGRVENTRRRNNVTKRIRDLSVCRISVELKRRGLLLPEYVNNYFDLVGCTPEQLVDHLEKQFQPGMTLDNYSKTGWCIDHIKPIAMFDLSDRSQIEECFHYTNIQPLWEIDNLTKGAIYNGVRQYVK